MTGGGGGGGVWLLASLTRSTVLLDRDFGLNMRKGNLNFVFLQTKNPTFETENGPK